jgi:hypothetical protein
MLMNEELERDMLLAGKTLYRISAVVVNDRVYMYHWAKDDEEVRDWVSRNGFSRPIITVCMPIESPVSIPVSIEEMSGLVDDFKNGLTLKEYLDDMAND